MVILSMHPEAALELEKPAMTGEQKIPPAHTSGEAAWKNNSEKLAIRCTHALKHFMTKL